MNANFRGKGASPTNDFWHQKCRVPELSYGEKKIAEKFNRLSRVHKRHRQTDRQTTDGRLIAYSDREREFTFAKNDNIGMVLICVVTAQRNAFIAVDFSRCSRIHVSISILLVLVDVNWRQTACRTSASVITPRSSCAEF